MSKTSKQGQDPAQSIRSARADFQESSTWEDAALPPQSRVENFREQIVQTASDLLNHDLDETDVADFIDIAILAGANSQAAGLRNMQTADDAVRATCGLLEVAGWHVEDLPKVISFLDKVPCAKAVTALQVLTSIIKSYQQPDPIDTQAFNDIGEMVSGLAIERGMVSERGLKALANFIETRTGMGICADETVTNISLARIAAIVSTAGRAPRTGGPCAEEKVLSAMESFSQPFTSARLDFLQRLASANPRQVEKVFINFNNLEKYCISTSKKGFTADGLRAVAEIAEAHERQASSVLNAVRTFCEKFGLPANQVTLQLFKNKLPTAFLRKLDSFNYSRPRMEWSEGDLSGENPVQAELFRAVASRDFDLKSVRIPAAQDYQRER